jgi:hypothetical protein
VSLFYFYIFLTICYVRLVPILRVQLP